MAAASSTAKPVARILLAYPKGERHAVERLTDRYGTNIVLLNRIEIRSSEDLNRQITEVRRILEDAAGIVFFNREQKKVGEHLQWLRRIGFASERKLPRFFVHYPGFMNSAELGKVKTALLSQHTDLSISQYPRLVFMLRDGLAPIIAKVRGNTVQSAKTLLSPHPKKRKVKQIS